MRSIARFLCRFPPAWPTTGANYEICWEGKPWVKVNGQTIHRGITFDPEGDYLPGRPDGIIGFGCHFNFPQTTMIFKNWSAKKLASPPSDADFPRAAEGATLIKRAADPSNP